MSLDAEDGLPAAAAPARSVRAVLVDDERLMREQLRLRLSEVWPHLEIVAEGRNGLEAVQLVQQHQPELIFLDIRMPGLSGVEAAREILQLDFGEEGWPPEIVFITAYDQYAVQAFDQGAIDYVLKPAQAERLQRTAQRVMQRLANREHAVTSAPATSQALGGATLSGATLSGAAPTGESSANPAGDAHPSHSPLVLQQLLHTLSARLNGQVPTRLEVIQAGVGTSIQMIPVAEVLFFISDEKYTRVQTASTEALIRKPIKELLAELDPQRFWQIHRSTIVNVQAVQAVVRDDRGRQIVSVRGHPQKLEVSRSFAGVFKGM